MTRLPSLLILSLAMAAPAGAATITVTSSADTTANDGVCTLREAIVAANTDMPSGADANVDMPPLPGECSAGAAGDRIHFAVPGEGPHRIMVGPQLPVITTPVIIDGFTQPGAQPNTINALSGFNADLRIVIDGSQSAAVSKPGLQFESPAASGSAVYGLEIGGFTSPACCADSGIALRNGIQDVVIAGNIVRNNKLRGIVTISTSGSVSNVRIGGPDAADRNAIYGHNSSHGVSLNSCVGCRVENNWIGVRNDLGVATAAGNSTGILIGGGTRESTINDNWIAASADAAIEAASPISDNTVGHNLIGGTFANQRGILIYNLTDTVPLRTRIEGNIITGNQQVGVGIYNSQTGNLLQGHVLVGNRIYANGQIEIDLGADGQLIPVTPAVTQNDAGDTDVGPNGQQNYPVLGTPMQVGNALNIPYTLDSAAGTFNLEFHFATQCDPSGHGLHGSMPRDPIVLETMALAGNASLQPVGAPAAGFVVATATGGEGTSEFSACVAYSYSVLPQIFANGFE